MREFLEVREDFLGRILDSEGRDPTATCAHCLSPGVWRCVDCLGRPLYCRTHCRDSHSKLISHRIQRWTGRFFLDSQIWEVGVKLYLGHAGAPCPTYESSNVNLEAQLDSMPYMHPGSYFPTDGTTEPDVEPEEDEPADDMPSGPIPFRRSVPQEDDIGNPFVLVVDSRQAFHVPVVPCGCAGTENILQYLDLAMFPASYINVRTVFTFRCLDDFRLSNLECKTTAYQYFQKIRRLTNPSFPQAVPNRYSELLRVSRQWRNLKLRKWFKFGHRPGAVPQRGEMALFCAACPQVNINLPEDWQTRYTQCVYLDSQFSHLPPLAGMKL